MLTARWRACLGLLILATLCVCVITNGAEPTTEPVRRFLDRGGFVEDTQTGLLWQKDGDASGKLNFYEAAEYARNLRLGQIRGWRVPTCAELAEIFPATELPFKDTKYTKQKYGQGKHEWNSYWSCDLDNRGDDYAFLYQWYADGGANNCYASRNYVYVRCVHDPVAGPGTRPVDPKQANGTP